MPITQTRMQDVLAECQMLVAHIESLRADAETIDSSNLDLLTKHVLVMKLFYNPRPSAPHSEQERQHFSRAQKRNEQSARRMRELRAKLQQKENENGLD